jgi:putative peptidoglycan lipid II flippase
MGVAGLAALQMLALLALANRVPGGVVAVQMGLTFSFFVVALVGSPVALSLLPRLAQLHRQNEHTVLRDTLGEGLSFALFLTLPAAVGLLALAGPLADVMAVGRMSSGGAPGLVATAIAALAPGIVAETVFMVSSYGSYARDDVRAPLRSMLVQASTFMALAAATLLLPDDVAIGSLALAFSVSGVVGAVHLVASLRSDIGRPVQPSARSLLRLALAVLAMAGPVCLLGRLVPAWVGGRPGSAVAVAAATVLGAVVYLSLQRLWHAPELSWVAAGLSRLRPGSASADRRPRLTQGHVAPDGERT